MNDAVAIAPYAVAAPSAEAARPAPRRLTMTTTLSNRTVTGQGTLSGAGLPSTYICWLSYEEALEKFEHSNQPETHRFLNYTSKPRILINRLGSYEDLYFQPLMDRIGEVKQRDRKSVV